MEIVRRALQAPARQIAINAGSDGSVIVGKILEQKGFASGWNAQDGFVSPRLYAYSVH